MYVLFRICESYHNVCNKDMWIISQCMYSGCARRHIITLLLTCVIHSWIQYHFTHNKPSPPRLYSAAHRAVDWCRPDLGSSSAEHNPTPCLLLSYLEGAHGPREGRPCCYAGERLGGLRCVMELAQPWTGPTKGICVGLWTGRVSCSSVFVCVFSACVFLFYTCVHESRGYLCVVWACTCPSAHVLGHVCVRCVSVCVCVCVCVSVCVYVCVCQ